MLKRNLDLILEMESQVQKIMKAMGWGIGNLKVEMIILGGKELVLT